MSESKPTTPEVASSSPQSIVTKLTTPPCVTLDVQVEGGNSIQRCPGIVGYQLLLVDSDSRMSVTVLDPKGHEWPLAYDEVISRSFTNLGAQAEWRVLGGETGGDVMALTIQVNANEDPESDKVTPYWAVARVSPAGSCVTARVEAGPDDKAELEAAMAAVRQRPCLSTQ